MIKLACATLSAEGFEYRDFHRTFEMLPAAGFRHVEFNLWFPETMLPSKVRDLCQRCHAAGLAPVAVHGNGFDLSGEAGLTRDLAHKIRLLEIACELGCDVVSISGVRRGKGGGLDGVIAVLRNLAPAAEELGVRVALENHADNNIENLADYEAILGAIDSPAVGVCIDTGHFDAADVDIGELIDRVGDRVNHIHVKENRGRGKVAFTRFGEGTTDNHHVIRRMIDRGFSGCITCELSPQDRPSTVEDLRTAYEMFRQYETNA